MARIDSHCELGPDTPLFSAGDGLKLSARQVKVALDAYQVYLDEPLRVEGPWRGTITVRNVVTWLRAGCPSDDLGYLIRHDRPAPPGVVTPAATLPAASAPIATSSAVTADSERGSEPIAPAEPSRPWRDRIRGMATNPVAWMWVWVIYCGLGFGSRIFIEHNPELTVWGISGAVVVGLLGAAAYVVGAFLFAGMIMGRGYSDIWTAVVFGAVGLGTGYFASHSYADAYEHLHTTQLAPLDTLVKKCLGDGIRYETYRVGAVCRDGWQSGATGRGACSHHGGVVYWIYPRTQTRTMQQCRQQASDTSWLFYFSDAAR